MFAKTHLHVTPAVKSAFCWTGAVLGSFLLFVTALILSIAGSTQYVDPGQSAVVPEANRFVLVPKQNVEEVLTSPQSVIVLVDGIQQPLSHGSTRVRLGETWYTEVAYLGKQGADVLVKNNTAKTILIRRDISEVVLIVFIFGMCVVFMFFTIAFVKWQEALRPAGRK